MSVAYLIKMMLLLIFSVLIKHVYVYTWFDESSVNQKWIIEQLPPKMENYSIDYDDFMIFSNQLSWIEAKVTCESCNSNLAIVDTPLLAIKLANIMTDSNIEMENLWIGGYKDKDTSTWSWINNISLTIKKDINGFPPWVRHPVHKMKNCLALDTEKHSKPLFVDFNCALPKPFVCQKSSDEPIEVEIMVPSTTVEKIKGNFFLYNTKLTWAEALTFCRLRGYRLAVIDNLIVAKVINRFMLTARPTIEHVWLSGYFNGKIWIWIPTGETIPKTTTSSGFLPPWHSKFHKPSKKCLLLDQHTRIMYFVPAACERKTSVLCEQRKYINETIERGSAVIKYEPGKTMLFTNDLGWDDAKQFCHQRNAHLTEVFNIRELEHIVQLMIKNENDPFHAWLGGKYLNNQWRWQFSKALMQNFTDSNSFMPWCETEVDPEHICLNLDRTLQNKPSVYGLNCFRKQPFFCTYNKNFKN